MKRRDMIKKTALGSASLGMAGCILGESNNKTGSQDTPSTSREMVYRELGDTGISVSLLGFGSHLSRTNLNNKTERDHQIQEGIENGITLFDVYNHGSYHQFEPMSKSLAGKRQKVVISLVAVENDVRSEIEGALETFNTDYIDLYRIVYGDPESGSLNKSDDDLDILFKMKEEGKIRAVGTVSHSEDGLLKAVENTPVDYIMMPMNFHHNMAWLDDKPDTYSNIIPLCREKKVGILTIKPLGGDPMVAYARSLGLLPYDYSGPSYPKAALRYLWQNEDVTSVFPSINSIGQLWDALETMWQPEFTEEERELLEYLSKEADTTYSAYLPPHYKWMENWRIRTV